MSIPTKLKIQKHLEKGRATVNKYKGFRAELAKAETFEQLKNVESKAAAAAEFAKKSKAAKTEQDEWGTFRVEIEQQKGRWLEENFPKGNRPGENRREIVRSDNTTLQNENISKNESSNARLTYNEAELTQEVIEDIKKNKSKIVTPSAVNSEIRKRKRQKQREFKAQQGKNIDLNIDFRLGDFEQVLSDIPNGSIDAVITDPPYPYEYIELYSKLAEFAQKKLKKHGFCIAFCGQMYLSEVINRMNEYLHYYWEFALYHSQSAKIINGVNIINRWKPVLIYQNGKKKINQPFEDFIPSPKKEKDGHDWQQSSDSTEYLIKKFTEPGQTICDPFAGSGTTILSCLENDRNIIAAEIDENTYNIAKSIIDEQSK